MVDAAVRVLLPLLALSGCGTSNPPRALCEQRYSRLLPSIGLQDATFWLSEAPLGSIGEPTTISSALIDRDLMSGIIGSLTRTNRAMITFSASGPARRLISYGCSRETNNLKLQRVVLRDKTLKSYFDIEVDYSTGH